MTKTAPTITIDGDVYKLKDEELTQEVSDLKSATDQVVVTKSKDRQIFDVATMLPEEPYLFYVNSSNEFVATTGWRLYPVEINGSVGDIYSFNIVPNSSGEVANYDNCNIWASNALPAEGASILQTGVGSGVNKRGTITLANDSKYLIIGIRANITTYPQQPFTDACNMIMEHIVIRRGGYTDTNYYPYEVEYVYKVIPYYQGSDNIGKILKVGADGIVTLMNESSGGDTPDNAVGYFNAVTLNVDSTMLTSDITLGTGWSGDLTSGFTHTSGSTEPLVFNTTTENGKGYIIDFDTSSQSENALYVSIGDEPLVDTYNGTTHIRVGIISDGGYLKITPTSGFTSSVTNLTCRKIILDGGTEITQIVKNVKDTSLGNNITGFWNVGIGGENTLKMNQNGSRNVGIGNMALRDLKTGTRNICIGTFAMPFVTEGDRNVAIGADTLYDTKNLTTRQAHDNIAIGKAAIQSGSNVRQNVGIGTNALGACADTATGNVAIGYQANYKAGNNNVAIGKNANYFSQGSNNVAIGYGSGGSQSTPAVSNSISIGYQVNVTKNNQMVLGGTNITEVVMCGNKKINFNQDGSVTWESIE